MSKTIEISVKGKWIAVPAVDVADKTVMVTGRWLKMATIYDEFWQEHELERPDLCLETLTARGGSAPRADVFTFMQKLPNTTPKYPYHCEWDSVAAVRLGTFKAWWDSLPQETRKNVRRAEKRGVVVCVRPFDDDLLRGIMDVNDDSPMRQGRPNAHYGKTIEQTRRDEQSFLDRCDFICAHLGDEMIGFLKVVYTGSTAAILNLASKASQRDAKPSNALIAKAVELCAARGATHLTYGMFNYGRKEESPLRLFKTRNGFEEVLVPRFYVPLTAKGKACLALNLHRGLLGVLPNNMITAGLAARTKWYDLKQSMVRSQAVNKPV